MKKTLFVLVMLAMTGSVHAISESEPDNNVRGGAVNFSIPNSLTGTLANDGAAEPTDYWSFTVTAGQAVRFAATVTGGGLGPDMRLDIENPSGFSLADADANGDGGSETLDYTFSTAGTYYLVVWEVTGTPNGVGNYTVNVTDQSPDTTAPTWPGGTAGINTVQRVTGNTSANITWFQAADAVTNQANIIYDIYYDVAQANVFVGAAETSVTGSLSTTLNGLNALSTYYVGVRARDAAGNRDTNTRTAFLDFAPTAANAGWALYE